MKAEKSFLRKVNEDLMEKLAECQADNTELIQRLINRNLSLQKN